MIDGKEDVAQALFSPRMIVDGVLQPETFKLRSSISEKLVGGQSLKCVPDGFSQDFLLLAIQRELVEIAQKAVCKL